MDRPHAVATSDAPIYAPGQTALLDGSGSTDPAGSIVSWSWARSGAPAGSAAVLTTAGSHASLWMDLAGDYAVSLTVTNQAGNSDSTQVVFSAVPPPTLRIELTWNTGSSDADLHVVDQSAGGQFFAAPGDCYYLNMHPAWGPLPGNDPLLDRDVIDGFGPENVTLMEPQNGGLYHLYAHMYDLHGAGPTTAEVKIFLTGLLVWDGTQLLAGKGDTWDVGVLSWPSAAFTPDGSVFWHSSPGDP